MSGGNASHPKLIVDINVGCLSRWSRIMGYDAPFVPGIEDGELVRLGQEQGRIILTRDWYIMRHRAVSSGKSGALLIAGEDVQAQLRQVVEDYHLTALAGLSSCIECNAPLLHVAR